MPINRSTNGRDRFMLGLTTLFIRPHRISKLSAPITAGTLLKFHKALVDRKYRLLFSSTGHRRKPGPKGRSPELIAAIIALKSRNPKFGSVRIAQELADAFGIELNKDVVRRVLDKHYKPDGSGCNGPSASPAPCDNVRTDPAMPVLPERESCTLPRCT